MKILKKYKSLFVMSCAAFAFLLVSVSNSFAAVDNVGKTDIVAYDSVDQNFDAEQAAIRGALIRFAVRGARAVGRGLAYGAGAVVGFVEGVVTGANGGPSEEIINFMPGMEYNRDDLTTFDQ